MKKIKIWIECARLRTLPVSIAGVVMATGLAIFKDCFYWIPALLCFVFAVLAQVVSNFANEYYDYKRGSDKKGRVGPRRGVTEGDISPKTLKTVTFATLLLTCVIGCGLIPFGGLWLIIVGIFIAVFALAYSTGPYPLSYHGLGDVAVFIFFGIIPVNLTYYVQSGIFELDSILASITIGLMGINVLLINNYRDVNDDKEAGKNTTVVIFGRKAASWAYLLNGCIAVLAIIPIFGKLPLWSLAIPVVYLILHIMIWNKLTKKDGAALNPLLGQTACNMLLFAILFCLVAVFKSV